MDWGTFIQGLAGGVIGGAGTVFGVSRWLGDWWLERQKARYSKELEAVKDALQQEQKRIQAKIDHSVLVTRAHFETEFGAMKDHFSKTTEQQFQIFGHTLGTRLAPN